MGKLVEISVRNLLRYKRRTLLTMSMITIGMIFVLVFISVSSSFKAMMIGEITDSMLGHVQIHRRGYVASIDNLPLNLSLEARQYRRISEILETTPGIAAFSPRIKFGGVFSNYAESTNIRINAVDPEREFAVVPLLRSRIVEGDRDIRKGDVLIPELLARGMKVGVGDSCVIIANNKDGSVNGYQFTVGGILKSVTGPGGRDGYIHIDDGRAILRQEEAEISEIALRLESFGAIDRIAGILRSGLSGEVNAQGNSVFEVHTWEALSPFFNIVRMIDVMTFFIQLMLVAIVLISIMNVMIMAVYERIREIGTMAAIGTTPRKILSLFVIEGLCLGVIGAAVGVGLSYACIVILNAAGVRFNFGQQQGLILNAMIRPADILWVSMVVIAVAAAASFRPALKASRLDPIEALRHV